MKGRDCFREPEEARGKTIERGKAVKRVHFYNEADEVYLLPFTSERVEQSQIQEQKPVTLAARTIVSVLVII